MSVWQVYTIAVLMHFVITPTDPSIAHANSNLHEDWAQYTHAKGQTTTLIKKEVFFARKLTRTKETQRVFGRP